MLNTTEQLPAVEVAQPITGHDLEMTVKFTLRSTSPELAEETARSFRNSLINMQGWSATNLTVERLRCIPKGWR